MIRLLSAVFISVALFFAVGSAKAQTFSWQATPGEPNTAAPSDSVTSIAISRNGHIFAGVVRNDGLYVGYPVGVFRSVDNGASWQMLPNPLNDQKGAIPLGPVFGCAPNGQVYMGGGKGLYHSNDDGTNMLPDTLIEGVNPTINSVAFAQTGLVLVATTEDGLCENDGGGWNTNIDIGLADGDNPEYVTCSPKGILYVVSSDEVFMSTNSGGKWAKVGGSFGIGASFAFDTLGNIIGGGNSGLFRSIDGGNSWSPLTNPATTSSYYSLAIGANGDMFLSPNDFEGDESGVYLSTDNGGSWNPATDGLGSTFVNGFAINNAGTVFAATGEGVAGSTSSVGIFDGVKSIPGDLPTAITLEQNHPNPVASNTTIRFAIPNPANVSIKVYDVTGSEVADIANGFYSPGTYDVSFDCSKLQSGMYIYRMEAGGQSLSRTFVVLP